MFEEQSGRKQGVYTCNLREQAISTKDDEANEFVVSAKGGVSVCIPQVKQMNERINERINCITENEEANELMDEELKGLPQPMDGPNARLFVISNSNIGCELLNEEQL